MSSGDTPTSPVDEPSVTSVSTPEVKPKSDGLTKSKFIWDDEKELIQSNVQAFEDDLNAYHALEQTKSIWAPEDARVNRWILRTDTTADTPHLLAALGLPPSYPICEVDCSAWKSFADVRRAMTPLFGEAWLREDLPEAEASELFWNPPFVVLRGITPIAAVAFSPFMDLYWSARLLYEQSVSEDEPVRASALIIFQYPYGAQSYDYGDDDKGVAIIPTIPL